MTRLPPSAVALALSGCFGAWTLVVGLGCGPRPPQPGAAPPAPPELLAPLSAADAGAYAGDAACAACHPVEDAAHRRSRHKLTLARADAAETRRRIRSARPVSDPELRALYQVAPAQDGCVLRVSGAGKGDSRAALPLELAVGSGKRGASYLARAEDGRFVELRLSYFANRKRQWDFTPGQESRAGINHPLGRKMYPAAAVGCFLCHSSAVVLMPDGNPDFEKSHTGVGCESCHGPGRRHAEGRAQGRAVGMHLTTRHGADAVSEMCGRCHRSEQRLNDPKMVSTAEIPRSPAFALSLSACYLKSDGRLNCVTCHDPHTDAPPAASAYYTRKCLSCHQPGTADQKPCPIRPLDGCVGCHMPAETAHGAGEYRFATHDIGIYRK